MKFLLALFVLTGSVLAQTPTPTPTSTPHPGKPIPGWWSGELGVIQNSCGPDWIDPWRVRLRVRVRWDLCKYDWDEELWACKARAHSRAGWWRGSVWLGGEKWQDQIDLYITYFWVSPRSGIVYRYDATWWWNHNSKKTKQLATYQIRVKENGESYIICSAKYRGFIYWSKRYPGA